MSTAELVLGLVGSVGLVAFAVGYCVDRYHFRRLYFELNRLHPIANMSAPTTAELNVQHWCGRCSKPVPSSEAAWEAHCSERHPELTEDALPPAGAA